MREIIHGLLHMTRYFISEFSNNIINRLDSIEANGNLLLNQTVLGMSQSVASIAIPVGAAILIFLAGWTIDKRKEYIKIKNFKKTVYYWIDSLKDQVGITVSELNKTANAIRESEDIHPERLEMEEVVAK